jgi:hypothetical protein
MNDTADPDQTHEKILAHEISDEALEAAAGTQKAGPSIFTIGASTHSGCCYC